MDELGWGNPLFGGNGALKWGTAILVVLRGMGDRKGMDETGPHVVPSVVPFVISSPAMDFHLNITNWTCVCHNVAGTAVLGHIMTYDEEEMVTTGLHL